MVVTDDNTAEQRPVVAERAIGNQWLISEGLQAGDKLILEGLQKIRPGAPVRAVELEAAPAEPAAGDSAPAADADTAR